jgi:integrase
MEQITIDIPKSKQQLLKPKVNSIKHAKDNALETHEQEELIRAVKSLKINDITKQRYQVLIHLLMHAGLRISEAIQTRRDWFNDTEDGVTINIPLKARDLRNMKRDWTVKTTAGAREVIFIDAAIGERVQSYFINNPRGLGFSRQRGGQIVKMLGELIGKPQLHPHALRSTYANSLIYKGVNATTLQYYMGWEDIRTAVNYVKASKIAARKDLLNKTRENKE